MSRPSDTPPRRIKIHKVALPTIGLAAIVAVAIWLVGLFGHSGSGGSGDNSSSQAPPVHAQPDDHPVTPQTMPAGPSQAVVVTIRQHDYLVNDKPASVQAIVAAAQQAAAAGITPPVQIVIVPDSREGAKADLEKALTIANIPYSELNTPSTTQP